MGGATSHDWHLLIVKMRTDDVGESDDVFWRPVFTAALTSDDIAAFLAPDDVREIRRAKPQNLALLLFKCMLQLDDFVAPTTAAVDDTSALNSIRMLAAVMPLLFEGPPVPPPWPAPPALAPVGALAAKNHANPAAPPPTSPYAEDFWQHFFLHNRRCVGAVPDDSNVERRPGEGSGAAVFTDLPSAAGASSFAPFAAQLMRLLVRCALVPGFTIGSKQPRSSPPLPQRALFRPPGASMGVAGVATHTLPPPPSLSVAGGASSSAVVETAPSASYPFVDASTCGGSPLPAAQPPAAAAADAGASAYRDGFEGPPLYVVPAQLWMAGLFSEAASVLHFNDDITRHRIELLRCLIATLTPPLFGTDALAPNPFIHALLDVQACPETGTLAACLLNVVVTHCSSGSVPFSSHYFAELPECLLALSLQVLGLLLHDDRDAWSASENEAARLQGCLRPVPQTPAWQLLSVAARHSRYIDLIVWGLHRLVENPLRSATTTVRNSQRFVPCYIEGLLLLWKAVRLPEIREAVALQTTKFLYPLMFFLQEARLDYSFFGAAQLTSFLLLCLSTETSFVAGLANPIAGKCPLVSMPPLPADGTTTYGDILVLSLCAYLSPAAPRWCGSFLPAFAVTLRNVSPYICRLGEVTCFELHHALDFVASANALRRGESSATACLMVVDAVLNLVRFHLRGVAPLAASIGSSDIPQRLRQHLAGLPVDGGGGSGGNSCGEDQKGNEKALPFGDGMALVAQLERLGSRAKEALERQPPLSRPPPPPAPVGLFSRFRFGGGSSAAPPAPPSTEHEMYNVLSQGGGEPLLSPPSSPDVVVHRYELTDEALRWTAAYLWGLIHKHNVRPPLFDAGRVQLFRLK